MTEDTQGPKTDSRNTGTLNKPRHQVEPEQGTRCFQAPLRTISPTCQSCCCSHQHIRASPQPGALFPSPSACSYSVSSPLLPSSVPLIPLLTPPFKSALQLFPVTSFPSYSCFFPSPPARDLAPWSFLCLSCWHFRAVSSAPDLKCKRGTHHMFPQGPWTPPARGYSCLLYQWGSGFLLVLQKCYKEKYVSHSLLQTEVFTVPTALSAF